MSVARLVRASFILEGAGFHRVRAQHGSGNYPHYDSASAAQFGKSDHCRGDIPRCHSQYVGIRLELSRFRCAAADSELGPSIIDARLQPQMSIAPWTAIFPGLMIFAAVMTINFIGDGLRDALDPHKSTH